MATIGRHKRRFRKVSDMATAIREAIQKNVAEIHTAIPGRIEKYDYSTQKADVKPLIKKRYVGGVVEALPVISNVPVVWPGNSTAALTFPLKRGDGVLLIFSERAIGEWLSDGGDTEPEDPRKFDLSDAIAVPGLYAFTHTSPAANNDDVALRSGTTDVILRKNGDIELNAKGVGHFKVAANGKVALGTGSVEVLDIIDQVIDALIGSVTATAIGPQLLSKTIDGTFATIKANLATIKGTV